MRCLSEGVIKAFPKVALGVGLVRTTGDFRDIQCNGERMHFGVLSARGHAFQSTTSHDDSALLIC